MHFLINNNKGFKCIATVQQFETTPHKKKVLKHQNILFINRGVGLKNIFYICCMEKNESRIQQEIYQYFNNNYCLAHHVPRCSIFAVPNGGTRNVAEAMSLKATGLRAGVSDLIILLPGGTTLFIEVKTESGKQSPKQIEFEQTVAALGFNYFIVRSIVDLKEILNLYF